MTYATLITRALLFAVFAVAGSAKLADLAETRATVEAFGVPAALARYGGTLLPFAELLTAAALLPQATARWGAVAALVLLLVFIAGIAYALSRGKAPDCNCFGQISSEQIGWRTLVRNGVLVAVAAFATAESPGSSFSAWTGNLNAAAVVASVAVLSAALLIVLVLRLAATVRAQRTALAAADAGTSAASAPGLPVGMPAPEFELPRLAGGSAGLASLRAGGQRTLLVFASPTCGPCTEMMPELARWSSALQETLNIAVVESGVEDPAQLQSYGGLTTLHERERELAERYMVAATPTALIVDADGRIGSGQALGAGSIERLIREQLRARSAPVAPVHQLVA